jgi:hypothetical protein
VTFAGEFWEDLLFLLLEYAEMPYIFRNRFILGIVGAVLCVVPELALFGCPSTSSSFCCITDGKIQALGFRIATIAKLGRLLQVFGFFPLGFVLGFLLSVNSRGGIFN